MATLLRTLALKSIMKFGKHKTKSVEYLISNKNINYLRWVYFNMSNISFNEEIILELRIPAEFQISKPGKNAELFDKLEAQDPTYRKTSKDMNPLKKAGSHRREKFRNSKSGHQRRNQGH